MPVKISLTVLSIMVLMLLSEALSDADQPVSSVQPASPVPEVAERANEHAAVPGANTTLEAALIAVCDGTDDLPTDLDDPSAWQEQANYAASVLGASTDPRHKLVAALLSRNTDAFGDRLQAALALGADDPLVLWYAFSNCSGDPVDCNASNLERRITTVDAQNSEVWIRVAVNRYARGDDDAALDAVRRAAAAGESRIYWPETMEAAYRALNAAGGFDATNSAILAHGLAASDFPRYQEITKMCRDQSAVSYDWALACLDYGRTSQKQSRADLAVLVGYFVQESALEALRDDRELARVKQQREAFRSAPLRATTETEIRIVDSFVMTEPGLFAYLDLLKAGTERSARLAVGDEIKRLQAANRALDCIL